MKKFINKIMEPIGERLCVRTILMLAWFGAAAIFVVCNAICHLLGHGSLAYYWDGSTAIALLAGLSYTRWAWDAIHDTMFGKEEEQEEDK